jgi:DNA-binding MarR family transcriptional regulator
MWGMDRIDPGKLAAGSPILGLWRVREALAKQRLSGEQYGLMCMAAMREQRDHQPMPTSFVHETRSGSASMSRSLRTLARRGLIERLSNLPSKRRTTHLRLTEPGSAALTAILEAVFER